MTLFLNKKLPYINEGIFEPQKSPVERGESSYIYK